MLCYIIDIDGTVADGRHRRHHVENKPENWDAFYHGCKDDAPFEHMRALVHALAMVGYIVYVSARPERCRVDTEAWLIRHKFHLAVTPPRLYMRPDGDYRPDDELKLDLLAKLRADGYSPIMAFDDRNRVVAMWRAAGIPCAQVAEGDF